jgi:hypothetical protein
VCGTVHDRDSEDSRGLVVASGGPWRCYGLRYGLFCSLLGVVLRSAPPRRLRVSRTAASTSPAARGFGGRSASPGSGVTVAGRRDDGSPPFRPFHAGTTRGASLSFLVGKKRNGSDTALLRCRCRTRRATRSRFTTNIGTAIRSTTKAMIPAVAI